MKTNIEHAKQQAMAQLECIIEIVSKLKSDDDDIRDNAQREVQDSALEVLVRTGWNFVSVDGIDPEEYLILLCTGGPAVRITGDLDNYLQPESVNLQYQDWFTPWVDYPLTEEEQEAVLIYCQQFWFGG